MSIESDKYLFVGIPAYREINANTVTSLLLLQREYKSKIGFNILSGCYIEHARNTLAKMALDIGADRLLFVDADVSFEPEDYQRLSDQLDKDPGMGAVCGIYVGWGGGGNFVTGWTDDDGDFGVESENQERAQKHLDNGDLVEVDKAGTGFMLIDTDVFKKIDPFWFATMVEAGDFWGEDTYFIHLLKHHGYRPSCDFSVVCSHIGPTIHKPTETSKEGIN